MASHHPYSPKPNSPYIPKTPRNDIETQAEKLNQEEDLDYTYRAQWLRAAILGVNDGLLSIASLMMGVGAIHEEAKMMILTGTAGLIAGALSMAIGEFVSVYAQYDIEVAQMKREKNDSKSIVEEEKLPNPFHAAIASGVAFSVGGIIPLLAAAFIYVYWVRLVVVIGVVSMALLGFGGFGAFLGKAPIVKSSLRILIGGWLAMGITYGLTKLVGSRGI